MPRTVSERAVLGQISLRAIHANKNDGEAWGTLQRVMTAAHAFCDTFVQDERVVDGWITRLTRAGWRYHDSAWEPAQKAPSNKVLTTMLSVAAEFFAFYAALSSPAAPAAPLHQNGRSGLPTAKMLRKLRYWRQQQWQRIKQRTSFKDRLPRVGGGQARQGSSTDGPHPVDHLALSAECETRGRPRPCRTSRSCARTRGSCTASTPSGRAEVRRR